MIEDKKEPNEWYQLSVIVDEWIADYEIPNFWHKALKWAIRGLERVRLNNWQDVKTCLLDVTSRKTVTLPGDFLEWVKVGAPIGQYAVTLGLNEDLRLADRTTDTLGSVSLLSQNPPNGLNFNNYTNLYFHNYDGQQIPGVGPGISSKGFYRVYDDGNCKELLMDFDYGLSQVYIEYITNGFDPCGQSVVSPFLKEYIMAYLDYKYEKHNNPKATEASRDRIARELADEIRILNANRSNLSPQVIINLDRKHFKLTTKI